MTAAALFEKGNCYWGNETIAGVPCTVGYKKEFRWSWFACQLNTFIFVGQTTEIIDRKAIETFSAACLKFALKNHKG